MSQQPDRNREAQDDLELWMRTELEALYNDVLEDPLPPQMAELLAQIEKKRRGGGSGGSDADA
ncbi:hypothetical protein [Minwuia thermotolerans]|uniref:hypothetical protein n=1 Tax=Minwuia thermotolerans TaxID=2056226 RepID=UPI000D6DC3D9|nr:hypothetical protein [Minwuia thermotolerans]